jgi:hypothetical protein
MVSASNDCGAIFADKTNLGNTTVTNSLDAETIVNDSYTPWQLCVDMFTESIIFAI